MATSFAKVAMDSATDDLTADLLAWMGPEDTQLLRSFVGALRAVAAAAGQSGGGTSALTLNYIRKHWTEDIFKERFDAPGRVTTTNGEEVQDLKPVWKRLQTVLKDPETKLVSSGKDRTGKKVVVGPDDELTHYIFLDDDYVLDYSYTTDLKRQWNRYDDVDVEGAAKVSSFLRKAYGEKPPKELRPTLDLYLGKRATFDANNPWHSQLGRALVDPQVSGPSSSQRTFWVLITAMLVATGASWAWAWSALCTQRMVLKMNKDAGMDAETIHKHFGRMELTQSCRPRHLVWMVVTLSTAATVYHTMPRTDVDRAAWVEKTKAAAQPASEKDRADILRALQGDSQLGWMWGWLVLHFVSHVFIDLRWSSWLQDQPGVPEGLKRSTFATFWLLPGKWVRKLLQMDDSQHGGGGAKMTLLKTTVAATATVYCTGAVMKYAHRRSNAKMTNLVEQFLQENNFTLERYLHGGLSGARVVLAKTQEGSQWVLKFINSTNDERFDSEANFGNYAIQQHVKTPEVYSWNDNIFVNKKFGCSVYGQRYIEGQTLYSKILSSTDEIELRQLSQKIILLVQTLEKAGIQHCDLHAQNLIVDQNNELFVIDWGLAVKQTARPQRCVSRRASTVGFNLLQKVEGRDYRLLGLLRAPIDAAKGIKRPDLMFVACTLQAICVKIQKTTCNLFDLQIKIENLNDLIVLAADNGLINISSFLWQHRIS